MPIEESVAGPAQMQERIGSNTNLKSIMKRKESSKKKEIDLEQLYYQEDDNEARVGPAAGSRAAKYKQSNSKSKTASLKSSPIKKASSPTKSPNKRGGINHEDIEFDLVAVAEDHEQ